MEKILEILQKIRSDVDFTEQKQLISSRVLDSYDIYLLVCALDEAFGIEIDINDMGPENFDSVSAIARLVDRHVHAGADEAEPGCR